MAAALAHERRVDLPTRPSAERTDISRCVEIFSLQTVPTPVSLAEKLGLPLTADVSEHGK